MVSLISVTASPASAFTGGQLTLFGLVGAGGAPPRHGKMEFPAGFMGSKGGRLAVVVGAAAGVQLRGFGLVGAGGAAPRHRKMAFPAGFVASKGGRLAVVAAAAPGESDGSLPSGDCEVKVYLELIASGQKYRQSCFFSCFFPIERSTYSCLRLLSLFYHLSGSEFLCLYDREKYSCLRRSITVSA